MLKYREVQSPFEFAEDIYLQLNQRPKPEELSGINFVVILIS